MARERQRIQVCLRTACAAISVSAGIGIPAVGGLVGDYNRTELVVPAILVSGLVINIWMITTCGISRRIQPIATGCVACIVLTSVAAYGNGSLLSTNLAVRVAQYLLLANWIVFASQCPWCSRTFFAGVLTTSLLLALGTLAIWISSGAPLRYAGFASQKNALASFAVVALLLSLLAREIHASCQVIRTISGLTLASSAILLGACSSRSALLLVAIFIAGTIILKPRPTAARVVLVTTALALVSIVSSYLFLRSSAVDFVAMDETHRSLFGVSVNTGRDQIWSQALQSIRGNVLCGLGVTPRFSYRDRDVSAHNLYLSVLAEYGVIGLIGLCCFLAAIWKALYRAHGPRSAVQIYGMVAFIAFLVRDTFEVSLTQNNLQMGLGAWVVISIAIATTTRPTCVKKQPLMTYRQTEKNNARRPTVGYVNAKLVLASPEAMTTSERQPSVRRQGGQ